MTTPSKTSAAKLASSRACWIIAAHSNGNFVPIEVCRSLEEAAQGLREALAQSRIAMSITPATDTMPGYLAELHKSYIIIPTLEKVDSEIARFDALKEGK